MNLGDQPQPPANNSYPQGTGNYARILIGLILAGLALWLAIRDVDIRSVGTAITNARPLFVVGGILVIIITVLAKAWRWQSLFEPAETAPDAAAARDALVLGQLFNLLLPAIRLGDIVRIFTLRSRADRAQILGTLVLEKSLDMIATALSLVLLIPFIVLPDVIRTPTTITAIAIGAFAFLVLLAFQANFFVKISRYFTSRLPIAIGSRIDRIIVAGLEGLAALRNGRSALKLLLQSFLIALLSILTPFVMFGAFNIQLGFAEAATVNAAGLIGSLPSTVPANLGVFELLVMRTLQQFGQQDESTLFAYAFTFHLVILLPVIVWGSLIIARTKWDWVSFIKERTRPVPLQPSAGQETK